MNYRVKNSERVLITIMLSITFYFGSAQDIYFEQYTDIDGLPSMTTYDMVQDENGLLWIGTENGLVSYDGEEFKTYTDSKLLDNDIIELCMSKEGYPVFFNLSFQLCILRNNKIEVLANLNPKNIYYIHSDKSGNYLHEYNPSFSEISRQIHQFSITDSMYLKTLISLKLKRKSKKFKRAPLSWSDPYGRIFQELDHNKPSFYLDSRLEENNYATEVEVNRFTTAEYLELQNVIMAKDKASYYALVRKNKCYKIDPDFVNNFQFSELKNVAVYDNMHFAIKEKQLEVYDSKSGKVTILLENVYANSVFKDHENALWVSTRDNGLYKIPNFRLLTLKEESETQDISNLDTFSNKVIAFWNDRVRIYSNQGKEMLFYNLDSGEKGVSTYYKNKILVVSQKGHLEIDPLTLKVKKNDIIWGNSSSYKTRIKDIEIYNDNILCVVHNSVTFPSYSNSQISFDSIKGITFDGRVFTLKYSKKNDLLLVGSTSGLYKLDQQFNKSLFIKPLKNKSISSIAESNDSSIWIGTKNYGVYRIKNDSIVSHFDITNGLLSNVINNIIVNGPYVYLATENGVSRINIKSEKVKNKNSCNGLPSDHITDLCVLEGEIWLAVRKNIVILDDSFFEEENISPKISIRDVFKNNQRIDYKAGMKLEHYENKVDIFLNNVSLSSGKNKSIKYRILNQDTSWTTVRESVIRLPALQPGKYTIEAIGINAAGVDSDSLKLLFFIKPPWWKTIWALMLFSLAILAIAFLTVGHRIKIEREKRMYLTQINKIRDQALQLQMNPHFIFNSLNAIQGFIGTDEEAKAMNYLARFARLIRLIFEHSKGNTISLEDELEFLRLYLDLEQLRFKDKVNVSIHIDSELENNKDVIQLPPLLIQPIVENSFKHGLFHKIGTGNLSIDLSLKNKLLVVVIQDDGIGRKESSRIINRNIEKQTSSGIKTTRERIDLLNFGLEDKLNKIEIIDLFDQDGNANGTKTVLELLV